MPRFIVAVMFSINAPTAKAADLVAIDMANDAARGQATSWCLIDEALPTVEVPVDQEPHTLLDYNVKAWMEKNP